MKELPGGVHVLYYFICKRKLWFYANRITMEHESELVEIGRYIELFYKEDKKVREKFIIDKISPDILESKNEYVLVYEIKKSSRLKDAAEWQLKYYLWFLNKFKGINVKGKLIIPEHSETYNVELDKNDIKILKNILKDIRRIIREKNPPPPVKKSYCRTCAYNLLCY